MSNRVATMASTATKVPSDISDIAEQDFALPLPANPFYDHSHLAPPPSSLGRALQQVKMTQTDGETRIGNGTPPSASSTASNSPRLSVFVFFCLMRPPLLFHPSNQYMATPQNFRSNCCNSILSCVDIKRCKLSNPTRLTMLQTSNQTEFWNYHSESQTTCYNT